MRSAAKTKNAKKAAFSQHARMVQNSAGVFDLYRPGSVLFGSLVPIPEALGKNFKGRLPAKPLHPKEWVSKK